MTRNRLLTSKRRTYVPALIPAHAVATGQSESLSGPRQVSQGRMLIATADHSCPSANSHVESPPLANTPPLSATNSRLVWTLCPTVTHARFNRSPTDGQAMRRSTRWPM